MLTVTKKAAALLLAAKQAEGGAPDSGIRIRRGAGSGEREVAVGFTISEGPGPGDETVEQDGLRVFVEDSLVETLDGRTLDVWTDNDEVPQLVFR